MSVEYDAYINSNKWKARRIAFIKQFRVTGCERCGKQGPVDLHHLHYGRLGREGDEDLQPLCRECHKEEHERRPKETFRGRKTFSEYKRIIGPRLAAELYPRRNKPQPQPQIKSKKPKAVPVRAVANKASSDLKMEVRRDGNRICFNHGINQRMKLSIAEAEDLLSMLPSLIAEAKDQAKAAA